MTLKSELRDYFWRFRVDPMGCLLGAFIGVAIVLCVWMMCWEVWRAVA